MTSAAAKWFNEAQSKAIASMIGSPVHIGQQLPRIGSAVPNGGEVIHVNPVKPEFTIRETLADTTYTRIVRFSVFRHAMRVASSM